MKRLLLLMALVPLLALPGVSPADAAPGTTTRASVASDGNT